MTASFTTAVPVATPPTAKIATPAAVQAARAAGSSSARFRTRMPVSGLLSALLCLLCLDLLPSCYGGGDGWRTGRATWYKDDAWMSVHTGSCQYGYLGDRFGGHQNWMVGAMNDGNPDYDGPAGPYERPAGCCGKCYEVVCEPMKFKDGYGVWLDRTTQCKNTQPVIITITDSCPCSKPENPYSNRRWCCADMNHFDLGIWAFQRMADPSVGVVGIKYRPVACPSSYGVPQVQAMDKRG